MHFQTFGMGMGSNPNLSRRSRGLYTSDVDEQNLVDFFNSKMIEMGISAVDQANPVMKCSATIRTIMPLSRSVITAD